MSQYLVSSLELILSQNPRICLVCKGEWTPKDHEKDCITCALCREKYDAMAQKIHTATA